MAHVRNRRDVRVGEVVAVVGGAALLAASWVVVAATKRVPAAEARVFKAVNDVTAAVWPVVWIPMQTGSLVGSVVVVAGTGVVSRSKRLTWATLVASQAAYWTAKEIKRIAARGRPGDLLDGVQVRERATGLGYLSGHTAVAFALATVIAPSVPRAWRAPVLGTAVVVGFGRIHGGAHLPLDVAGGIGIGILYGTLSRWAFGLGGEGLPATAGATDRGHG